VSNYNEALRFRIELENFAKREVPEEVLALHQATTMDLLRRLVSKSPVGNPEKWKSEPPAGYVGGTFRGFWQVYANSDPVGGSLPPPKGTTPRTEAETDAAAASEVLSLVPFSTSYIVNGMPYGPRLNAGWSRQAPAGFVELALAEVQSSQREAFDEAAATEAERQNRLAGRRASSATRFSKRGNRRGGQGGL
jgi:hypothetical protein